jgi:uncharacterized protein YraI
MKKKNMRKFFTISVLIIILTMVLSACAGEETPVPTQDVAKIQTEAAQTVVADLENVEAQGMVPTMAPPPGPTPDPNIPVAVIPTPVSGEPTAIANYNTTINSGPGTNYVVYSVFVGSQTAKVVGKSENGLWWAVSVPVAPGGVGWVDAGWVTVSNTENVPVLPTPPVPPTVELVPPGPDDPQATAIANVYVRTGPATSFPAYGIAPIGASGRVIGKSEDNLWWVVRLNPDNVGVGYGWVMAQYTSAVNVEGVQTIASPQAPPQYVPPAPPAGVPTVTAVDYVNVRSGPSTNFMIYLVAPPGAAGEAVGKNADGTWWQVKISTEYAPDGLGWVSADWVTTQNTENVPVVESPPEPPPVPATPPPTTTTGCSLYSQNPADGSVFEQGLPFSTTWVLMNTGTEKWAVGEYDIAFVGAYNNVYLHTGLDIYDLYTNVDPGMTYNVTVPMVSPYGPGMYGEMWQLMRGNQIICQFYIYIESR